jgi:hypothetical protein
VLLQLVARTAQQNLCLAKVDVELALPLAGTNQHLGHVFVEVEDELLSTFSMQASDGLAVNELIEEGADFWCFSCQSFQKLLNPQLRLLHLFLFIIIECNSNKLKSIIEKEH